MGLGIGQLAETSQGLMAEEKVEVATLLNPTDAGRRRLDSPTATPRPPERLSGSSKRALGL